MSLQPFRRLCAKLALQAHDYIYPKLIAHLCEPLFGGLHPSNVFHYRTEFIVQRLQKDSVVVDLACGTGKGLAAIAPYIRHGIGIELNPTNFSLCLKHHSAPHIEYRQRDIFDLDYRVLLQETGCNAIVLSHILEHIEDSVGFLKRILAPTLFICVPSQQNWEKQLRGSLGLNFFSDHGHFREYTPEMLRNELDLAGYDSVYLAFNCEGEIECEARKRA
jgi:SAM-dependent methyltransferase